MVLINGRKFACEACIRGHRASGCAHTGRQMQLVRPKGRPSSQCDVCRARRATGSFHGRCDCKSRKSVDESSSDGDHFSQEMQNGKRKRRGEDVNVEVFCAFNDDQNSNTRRQASTDSSNVSSNDGGKKGKHSLEAIMNPCQCRSSGNCSCCKSPLDSDSARFMHSTLATNGQRGANAISSCRCDGGENCCSSPQQKESCTSQNSAKRCCHKTQNSPRAGASTHMFDPFYPQFKELPQVKEENAIMNPECQCGLNCSCPGCFHGRKDPAGRNGISDDDCPNLCETCSACVYGLSRPSGIEAVDSWIEQDRIRKPPKGDDQTSRSHDIHSRTQAPSPPHVLASPQTPFYAASTSSPRPPAYPVRTSIPPPTLPPIRGAKAFYNSHFLDSERRHWFSSQMNTVQDRGSTPYRYLEEPSFADEHGEESNEAWQSRHGYSYLTPETVKIFDHARAFREQRRREEEEEEEKENPIHVASLSTPSAAPEYQELSELRQRALQARQHPTAGIEPIPTH